MEMKMPQKRARGEKPLELKSRPRNWVPDGAKTIEKIRQRARDLDFPAHPIRLLPVYPLLRKIEKYFRITRDDELEKVAKEALQTTKNGVFVTRE